MFATLGRFAFAIRMRVVAGAAMLQAQQQPAPDNSKVNARDSKPRRRPRRIRATATADVETTRRFVRHRRRFNAVDVCPERENHHGQGPGDAERAGAVRRREDGHRDEGARSGRRANVTNQVTVAPKSGDKKPAKKAGA